MDKSYKAGIYLGFSITTTLLMKDLKPILLDIYFKSRYPNHTCRSGFNFQYQSKIEIGHIKGNHNLHGLLISIAYPNNNYPW